MSIGHSFTSTLVLLLASQAVAHLELHGARDRFWRHNKEEKVLMVEGENQYFNIESCIDESLTEEDKLAMKTESASNRNITKMYTDESEEWIFLVSVENAIIPSHVKAVQALGACVRKFIPNSYEARSMSIEMGYDKDVGLGGNCPTHLAPLVGLFLPYVFDDMERLLDVVYKAAGWAEFLPKGDFFDRYDLLPDPKDVGFRATEHLTYDEFKEGLKDHTDGSDTKYTFNYAFSGPEDYGGGEFYINYEDGNDKLLLKPKRYEAMVFLGGYYAHGVQPITSGKREMFSNELWTYPDAPFGSNLWSNTGDRMWRYIDYCDEELEKGNTGPCQVDFTKLDMSRGRGRYGGGMGGGMMGRNMQGDDEEEEEEYDDEEEYEGEYDEEEEYDDEEEEEDPQPVALDSGATKAAESSEPASPTEGECSTEAAETSKDGDIGVGSQQAAQALS
eukprot:CAMPEP_0172453470 /NCGR_PEP_ID=MMETSP1065-20121228/10776_1 /TAXON_ID=265537 /ORGANISM="Amphiprora paludosa, Strain CCMP125" /LENGTH=445 /DNA_ID=CAMNT_0013205653 /DNA_START=260 /DNA_END=1597 /DNA_ORIENTATION=-